MGTTPTLSGGFCGFPSLTDSDTRARPLHGTIGKYFRAYFMKRHLAANENLILEKSKVNILFGAGMLQRKVPKPSENVLGFFVFIHFILCAKRCPTKPKIVFA